MWGGRQLTCHIRSVQARELRCRGMSLPGASRHPRFAVLRMILISLVSDHGTMLSSDGPSFPERDASLPSLEPGSIIEIYINSGYVVDVSDYPELTVEACIVNSLQDSNTANICDTAAC